MSHEVVCLIGSTKFKDKFFYLSKKMTIEGFVVLMPHIFEHSGDKITPEVKENLMSIHKQKIRMCDYVILVSEDGYIGNSTKEEIEYAKSLNKTIIYR